MRIDILTLFPEMFDAVLGTSIPKRAAEKGLVRALGKDMPRNGATVVLNARRSKLRLSRRRS